MYEQCTEGPRKLGSCLLLLPKRLDHQSGVDVRNRRGNVDGDHLQEWKEMYDRIERKKQGHEPELPAWSTIRSNAKGC